MTLTPPQTLHRRLLHYLLLNSSFTDKLGLLDGKAGTVLYAYLSGPLYDPEWINDIAFSFLEETMSMISLYTPLTFGHGAAGIGSLLEYLHARGQLQGDTNELLEEIEPYLLNTAYQANLDNAGIATGVSGLGLYFIHRLSGQSLGDSTAADPFRRLRIQESLIACLDQVSWHMENVRSIKDRDHSLFNGWSGVSLFLYNAHELSIYPGLTEKLGQESMQMLQRHLTTASFAWGQVETWAVFYRISLKIFTGSLHEGELPKHLHNNLFAGPFQTGEQGSRDQQDILSAYQQFIQQAPDHLENLSIQEMAPTAMWLKMIMDILVSACTETSSKALTGQVCFKELIELTQDLYLEVLELAIEAAGKTPLPELFPYDPQNSAVNTGLSGGVCQMALPLLSMYTKDLSWLSLLGFQPLQQIHHQKALQST